MVSMIKKFENQIHISKYILYISILLLVILRILLGYNIGIWIISDAGCDDALMINYASKAHFFYPDSGSLLKYMGFLLLLLFNGFIGIPFSVLLSLIWVIAALLVFFSINTISHKKNVSFLFYVFTLFMHCAFELKCGTQLYRNIILAPICIIFFSLSIIFIYKICNKKLSLLKSFAFSILLGLVFTYIYYIKEDGVWLLAVHLFWTIILIIYFIYKKVKKISTLNH